MNAQATVVGMLTRTFGAMVLLIVLSGSAGIAASVLQHRSVQNLSDYVLPLRLANAQLRAVLADAQRGLRGYLLTADAQLLDTYRVAKRAYPATEAALRQLARAPERGAVELQSQRAQQWWVLAQQQRLSAPRSDQAVKLVEEGKTRFDAFIVANNDLDGRLARRGTELRADSDRLQTATTVSLALLTLVAGLLATLAAGRATRKITGPLRRLATVLDRLGGGDRDVRAAATDGPAEIRRVAGAFNTMVDESERLREQEADDARLRRSARALGVRIRQHLVVDSALRVATDGLGDMLDVEHVIIRMAGGGTDGPAAVCWAAPDAAVEPGALSRLSDLSLDWLEDCAGTWVTDEVRAAGADPAPPAERQALLELGCGPVATLAVGSAGDQLGSVTLIRRPGRPAWSAAEVRTVEAVAADLGRGVRHAQMYEQEKHLVVRLQELDTAKTDFMSTVSHELRTPLTSIAGYVEMLRDGDAGPISGNQAKMLDVIDRNTTRLRALISDLLILSKIEVGTFKTQRKTVDLATVVDTAREAIEPVAVRAGVVVQAQVAGPLAVPADPEQIDRVLMGLLSNAVKFTPAGGNVQVRVHRDGDEVILSVADSGMGIPQPEQQRLFSRFFRASNAIQSAVPGTGLGLAIVHTIVQNHGGRIEVFSREGDGTTFTVRLPVH
ncbi:MAG TPA: ATP-binding protein [Catenuloplanes sp.]|jgi:signal transduction histidine kinase/CHASE3 domain sensor protein